MTLKTQTDPIRKLVKKFIQKFFWNKQPFSIINYLEPVTDIQFVQVETDKEVTFPPWLHISEEVTDDPNFWYLIMFRK